MNQLSQKLRQHPSFIFQEDIKTLCMPLTQLNITVFSHLRVFNDKRLTVLCNHSESLQNYMRKKYYEADPCVNTYPVITADIGQYLLWDSVNCSGKTAQMLSDSSDLGFKHVFTIIKKELECTNFYHFGTQFSDPAINQMYVNNLDLLDRFISFFTEHVEHSKKLSSAYDISLNADQSSSCVELNIPLGYLENKKNYLNQIFRSKNISITAKELECIKLLVDGKTAKEIAGQLRLSPRTIEDRVDSLKNKFNAQNKTDLIVRLLQYIR